MLATQNKDIVNNPVEINGVIDLIDPKYSFLLDTFSDDGIRLFFSSIPGKMNREEEVEFAMYDVARQAAMIESFIVIAKFAVLSDSNYLGYLESIYIEDIWDRITVDFETKIKIKYHFRDNENTYILASFDGTNFEGNYFPVKGMGIQPDWLNNIPEIPGYLVSSGTENRSRYIKDSMRKADELAIANLARQISVAAMEKTGVYESEKSVSIINNTQYQVSYAIINGFYVLGRWITIDDGQKTYHSLAVCLDPKIK